jgi:catechol 2,3-dioxygenase-like lactoylglutathione lyase family enzyme
MFGTTEAFSSFSVDDIDAARRFYGDTLGLGVEDGMMGNLTVRLGGGGQTFIYLKPDHAPAGFTVLNFPSDDVEKTVDELNSRGVTTKIYGDSELDDMPPNDAKGIMHDETGEATIAWFRDPAGNVLAVVASRMS